METGTPILKSGCEFTWDSSLCSTVIYWAPTVCQAVRSGVRRGCRWWGRIGNTQDSFQPKIYILIDGKGGIYAYVLRHSVMSNSCNSMDCTPPGFSVHRIFQARILEDLPAPGIKPVSPALAGGDFTPSATWEAHLYVYIIFILNW